MHFSCEYDLGYHELILNWPEERRQHLLDHPALDKYRIKGAVVRIFSYDQYMTVVYNLSAGSSCSSY